MNAYWTNSRWLAVLAALVVAAAALLTFGNALDGTFHHDDHYGLLANPAVRSLKNVGSFFTDPATLTALKPNQDYRPLLQVTYALSYASASAWGDAAHAEAGGGDPGYDARFWLAGNVLLHTLAALLALRLAWQLLRGVESGTGARLLCALGAALLFAVHPLATEPVNYLWARSSLLKTALYLASFAMYWTARGGSWPMTLGALGLFLAALLTKISALTLPATLLLAECLLGGPEPLSRRLRRLVPYAFLAVGYLLFYRWILPAHVEQERHGPIQGLDYLWIQTRAWFHYLLNFVHPFQLAGDIDFQSFGAAAAPWPLGPDTGTTLRLALVLGLAMLALALSRRAPLVTFAAGWFALTLAPTSTFAALAEPVNDHRPYVGLFGLTLGSAWLLVTFVRKLPGAAWQGLATVGIAFAGVTLAVTSHERNRVWRSDAALWQDVVERFPGHAKGHMNLGLALRGAGYRAARPEERKALFDLAGEHLQTAVRVAPHYDFALTNWAIHLAQTGRVEEAGSFHDRAVALRRGSVWSYEPLLWRARFHESQGNFAAAIADAEEALRVSPREEAKTLLLRLRQAVAASRPASTQGDEVAVHQAGLALIAEARLQEALVLYDRATQQFPAAAWPLHNAGWLCQKLNAPAEAIKRYEELLRRDPLAHPSRVNLGLALESLGQFEQAVAQWRAVPATCPEAADAQRALARHGAASQPARTETEPAR